MNNKTNQGILPFQMVKIAGDNIIPLDGYEYWRRQQQPQQPQQPKGQGTLDLFATGNGYRNADGELGKTPIEVARANKSKKRGLWSAIFSPVVNVVKKHPITVGTTLGVGSVAAATPALLNLFGDDNNSSESNEAPKTKSKAEPAAQPVTESKPEPKAEPKPDTPNTNQDPTPKPSTTTPTNGTGGSAGAENKDFIDRSIQSINEFKAKHPELFWSGVGLAGLGSVYALAKALDDDDDDDDYYYYRHR